MTYIEMTAPQINTVPISVLSTQLLITYQRQQFFHGAAFLFGVFTLGLLINVSLKYWRFLGARIFAHDLPAVFLKEKLHAAKVKLFNYWVIPVYIWFVYLCFRVSHSFLKDPEAMRFSEHFAVVFEHLFGIILLLVICDILAGVQTIWKQSRSPSDAYAMFGLNQVKHSLFTLSALIVYLPLLFLFGVGGFSKLDMNNDPHVAAAYEQLIANPDFTKLRTQDPTVYQHIIETSADLKRDSEFGAQSSIFVNQLASSLAWILPVVFALHLIFYLLLGKIMEAALAYRFSHPKSLPSDSLYDEPV
jgi:hypothetical protein